LATAALAAALLPLGALPALASTEVAAAPLPAPTGLAPADDPDTFPQTVRKDLALSWNAVAGATAYRVQFGRDDTWSDQPIASFDVKSTALIIPQGDVYQTYVWRVAALKGQVLGHWTSESTNSQNEAQFTKGWRTAPGSLSTAFDGATVPTFSWTAVPGASAYRVVVSLSPVVDMSADIVPPDVECTTTRNRLTPVLSSLNYAEGADAGPDACKMPLEANKQYYWRVQGIDQAAGAAGGPEKTLASIAATFTTPVAPSPDYGVIAAPTLSSMATDPDRLCTVTNASPERALCNDVPSIRWLAVAGAKYYKLTLSPDDLFQSVVDVIKTEGTSWTPQKAWGDMSPSMAMYYDVSACNDRDAGAAEVIVCEPAVTGDAPSFRKVSPRLSGLSTPTATGRLAFSWTSYAQALAANERPSAGAVTTASQDAKGYHLQVATSAHPSFDTTVIDVTTDGPVTDAGRFTTSGGTTFIPTSELLLNGSFVWRVQPVDSAGNKLPWSLSKAFTRDNTAPTLLSVSPSVKVGVTQPLTLKFSEPVTGVSASSISVSPAVGYTVTVLTSTTARLTPSPRWLPGATYTVTPTSVVKDTVGNSAATTGRSFTVNPLVDNPSPAMSYSSGWRVLSATNAVGGTFRSASPTSTSRPFALMTFRGTGVSLTSCLGPSNGYVELLIDGVRKVRASTYRSFSGCGIKVATVTGLPRGLHQVKVLAVGAHVSASRGNNVSLDALTVTP